MYNPFWQLEMKSEPVEMRNTNALISNIMAYKMFYVHINQTKQQINRSIWLN